MDGMTKIILLIIAFQVVMGIFAKRKARDKAEAEAEEAEEALMDAEEAADPQALREQRAREQARRDAAKAAAAREHSRQEAERAAAKKTRLETMKREREEEAAKSDRWGDRGGNDRGEQERAGKHPDTHGQGKKPQGQAAQLGKDLLSQIAKELGLEMPHPQQPRPAPRPSAPSPQSQQGAKKPAQHAVMPSAAHAQRRPSPHEWENSSRRPRSAPPMESPSVASAGSLARESMLDLESIRSAIILKTILDKPLALRRRIPGISGD